MATISQGDLERENVVDCCCVVGAFIGRRLGELLVGKKPKGPSDEGPRYINQADIMRIYGLSRTVFPKWKQDPEAPQPNRLKLYSVKAIEQYLEG